jgi:hypothetical protein
MPGAALSLRAVGSSEPEARAPFSFGRRLKTTASCVSNSEKLRDRVPERICRQTAYLGFACLLGELLHFEHGDRLPCFLGHFLGLWWQRPWDKSIHLVGVEPDEVTYPANVHSHASLVGKRHFDHRIPARRTLATALTFAANGVQPKRIDGLRRKRAPQEFETNGPSAAIVARPKHTMRGAHLLQSRITSRTGQFRRGFCSHWSRALSQFSRGATIKFRSLLIMY